MAHPREDLGLVEPGEALLVGPDLVHADMVEARTGRTPERLQIEHRPHERALTLTIRPWVEVVRDQGEVEARGLRPHGLADQFGRAELLARELVSDVEHRRRASPD